MIRQIYNGTIANDLEEVSDLPPGSRKAVVTRTPKTVVPSFFGQPSIIKSESGRWTPGEALLSGAPGSTFLRGKTLRVGLRIAGDAARTCDVHNRAVATLALARMPSTRFRQRLRERPPLSPPGPHMVALLNSLQLASGSC